jgi:hypothetical protein
MKLAIRVGVTVLLVFAGWLAGSAQSPRGDFIIRIDGPSDSLISVECIEGCVGLIGGRDVGLYREENARTTYSYGPCRGTPDGRCRATFHGFLKK